MSMIELALRSYDTVVRRPFLQPTLIPQAPVKHDYYNGILMNGVFAYRTTTVSYYATNKPLRSLPIQAKPVVAPSDVFSGRAPYRGVFTGVKNGRY